MKNSLRMVMGAFFLTVFAGIMLGEGQPNFGPIGKVTVVKRESNLTAQRLLGTWVPGGTVAESLGIDEKKRKKYSEVCFKEDETCEKKILDALDTWLKGSIGDDRKRALQAVYLCGSMRVREGENEDWGELPFALVSIDGNNTIIYLADGNDREELSVHVVYGAKTENDVLLFGYSKLPIPLVRKK